MLQNKIKRICTKPNALAEVKILSVFLPFFFMFPTNKKLKEIWITAVEIPCDQIKPHILITETYFTTRLKFAKTNFNKDTIVR